MDKNIEKQFIELLKKSIKTKDERLEMTRLRLLLEEQIRVEQKNLLTDLAQVGIKVSTVWDLVNTKASYPEAIPVLIEHLSRPYHDKIKEGIVRALAVKEAKGKATAILIKEYYNTPKEKTNLRWVFGNTITMTISESDVNSILSIVQDKENGMSRQMFIAALGKIKSIKSEDVLIKLLNDDPQIIMYTLKALGSIKSAKAKDEIIKLLHHPDASIQEEAKKTLKKIGSN